SDSAPRDIFDAGDIFSRRGSYQMDSMSDWVCMAGLVAPLRSTMVVCSVQNERHSQRILTDLQITRLALRPTRPILRTQLRSAEIERRYCAVRPFKYVGLVDLHHRHPPALGRERVVLPGKRLFFREQLLSSGLPQTLGGRRAEESLTRYSDGLGCHLGNSRI